MEVEVSKKYYEIAGVLIFFNACLFVNLLFACLLDFCRLFVGGEKNNQEEEKHDGALAAE